MLAFANVNEHTRVLFVASVGLCIATISELMILCDVCGSGRRLHRLEFVSEHMLTCKHSDSTWHQALPWLVVVGFTLLLPALWYTWTRVAVDTESIQADGSVKQRLLTDGVEEEFKSKHRVARFTFGTLLLVSFIGFVAGIHYELDGGWPDGKKFRSAHKAGFFAWGGALFTVHAMTLFAYARLNPSGAMWYKFFELVYGVLLAVFFVLLAVEEAYTPFLQTTMLISVFFVSLGNIVLGYTLEYPKWHPFSFASTEPTESRTVYV